MPNKRILIPIPSYGFDPTEVAIPWKILIAGGFEIVFSTPQGNIAEADKIILTGKKLGLFKKLLQADKKAIQNYNELIKSKEFNRPIKYKEIAVKDFIGIYLPGGHDKRVREYLESTILQNTIADFFLANKKIGAICHGALLVARSKNAQTGKSVLYNRKTTALLKIQELSAYSLTKWWLKDYYLTYPEITIEDEIKTYLKSPRQFVHGPLPILKDSPQNLKRGFSLKDKNYLSARWPGDIYNFSFKFKKMLQDNL